MKAFRAPGKTLGTLDAEATAALITAAADVALIVDEAGIIRDAAFNSEELAQELEGERTWLGRPWLDTVAEDSRVKVESMLRDAAARSAPRWRHVNQITARGGQVPVLFSAVPIADQGRVVAFGRDLRPLSVLQQRLVEAQQSLERDYSRLRHAETRYRLLFQISSEPLLIVDAATQRVQEANPAAASLIGPGARRAIGRPFPDVFELDSQQAIELLLASVRAAGRADDVRGKLADGAREVLVTASMFRQDQAALALVRLTPLEPNADSILLPKAKSKLLKLVEGAPDAFVVATADGRVLTANAAFLDLAQMPNEDAAVGEPLDRWIGRPGVELEVLMAALRQKGSVRLFATTLRGEFGATAEVEISAVSMMNGGKPCHGFTIRDIGPRPVTEARPGREPSRSVEQLTELIGRVPLKDLVREATDQIERLCIEAALEITGDNRASAAEMLGLSRQSLYVKLRRYGLGDLGADPGEGG